MWEGEEVEVVVDVLVESGGRAACCERGSAEREGGVY
jgi:hypothetical protein